MHVIGHEDPSMNVNFISSRAFKQPVRISRHVTTASETDMAVVPALNNMHRVSRRTMSGWSRQVRIP